MKKKSSLRIDKSRFVKHDETLLTSLTTLTSRPESADAATISDTLGSLEVRVFDFDETGLKQSMIRARATRRLGLVPLAVWEPERYKSSEIVSTVRVLTRAGAYLIERKKGQTLVARWAEFKKNYQPAENVAPTADATHAVRKPDREAYSVCRAMHIPIVSVAPKEPRIMRRRSR